MEESQLQYVSGKLAELKSRYQVDIAMDWGYDESNGAKSWRAGTWSAPELDDLQKYVDLLSNALGGVDRFIQNIGGVTVKKSDIGSHAGEALAHRVSLSAKAPFTAWTVAHEFAHAWDANHKWQLSAALEKYTGGHTSRVWSLITKVFGNPDSGIWSDENKPGRRGRKPGCNAAGYFYGDKPSGSNWKFNRLEDFAESVVMYIGWQGGESNPVAERARARISRFTLENGKVDTKVSGLADNWADYAKYFYPEGGDYRTTKRWQFVDELVKGGR